MSTKLLSRLLAALLCLLMLGSTFVACAQDGTSADTTAPGGSTTTAPGETTEAPETVLTSSVDPVDLNKQPFSVITRLPYDYLYPYHEILAEETTGDALNDAVHKRNLIIEERYNCDLVTYAVDKDTIVSLVNQEVMSNNGEYDLIVSSVSNNISWAQKQYLVELHEYDDIIRFEKPWWMGHILESNSLGGKNFYCPSDVNIAAFNAICITYFNKDVATKYEIENPYDLVRAGKWTFDKMNELCVNVYEDANGSQTIDAEDTFGMILNSYAWQGLFYGSDKLMIVKDENDMPKLAANTENVINYLQKIIDFSQQQDYVFNAHNYSYGGTAMAEKFRDQQSLFYIEAAYSLPNLRDMEVDFGVLPMPKADEAQADYISTIHTGHSSAMSVPNTNADFDTTARILEDMAFYSYQNIRPVFVEQMVKTRMSRDADSYEMFNYIYEHVVLDLVLVFSSKVGIDGDVREFIKNGGGTVASTLASNDRVYSTLLERSVNAILGG